MLQPVLHARASVKLLPEAALSLESPYLLLPEAAQSPESPYLLVIFVG